ncbi:importin-alpha export receptor [Malassezia sp. CBS 17886]|nr:importin-alpha export receptor [Malassezia sp. CBS 17886]
MDHTDPQQLASLATLFQQTLNPAQRQAAEGELAKLQVQPRFAFLLLALIQSDAASTAVRLAAAIQFKNVCKLRWEVDSETEDPAVGAVADAEKGVIRAQLLPELVALASVPAPSHAILAQLSESIALVAQSDFPAPWASLVDELVVQLGSDNYFVLLSVLTTSHAIFRRWRSMFRSDALYSEINLVLSKYAGPLLALLHRLHSMLVDPASPAASMAPLASCLVLVLQLFYDLSAQDLPPQFEDALPALSPLFTSLLSFSRAELVGDEEDAAPSPLDKIRSSVCEVFELYAKRYLDVLPELPMYVQAVWDMLATYGPSEKYDVIVCKAIGFLAVVVRMGNQRALFQADATLEQFCTAIILPNVQLRDVDEEMFEDNPMEYIRRDMETSVEVDTRRRAAAEFVHALLEQFAAQITAICSRHIRTYLDAFHADPLQNWKKKDAAIYLLTSIATESASTQHGVSATNALVDVVQFFSDHVLQDLQADDAVAAQRPILQVDAIKYLYTFRNQLSKEQLLAVLPLLVQHLASPNYITCTYAAITIERVLYLRTQGHFLIAASDLGASSEKIFAALFAAMEQHKTPEKVAENDHLIKCVMRVLLTMREGVEPYAGMVLAHLVSVISVTAQNPSNPRFSQFLFESLSALIRYAGSGTAAQMGAMEQALFPVFTQVLQSDVAEYIPYVFQIMAQLLEAHAAVDAARTLPPAYTALLPPLLTPALWEQKGNVPALVRLLKAYLRQTPGSLVENAQVEAFLGIYQKLISSRLNDVYGFDLLTTLLRSVPPQSIAAYFQPVLTLMLMRLQSSKTEKFSQHFVVFFGAFCGIQQDGYPEQVVLAFDSVQPGLFAQLLQNVVLPDTAKLSDTQRFDVAAGLLRLLTRAPSMLTTYAAVWASTLAATLQLLGQTHAVPEIHADDDGAADLDEQGFQASFAQLAASLPARDVGGHARSWAGPDLWAYAAEQLGAANQRNPGVLPPLLQTLPQDVASPLTDALMKKGLAIG